MRTWNIPHLPEDRIFESTNERLRSFMNEIELPEGGFGERVMQRLDELEARPGDRAHVLFRPSRRRIPAGKAAIAVSAAAAVGLGTLGSGFVSPAMAAALQHLPVIGSVFAGSPDVGLQRAAEAGYSQTPALSVTREGVTFTVTDVLYDGTRLVLAIQKEGAVSGSVMSPAFARGEAEPNLASGLVSSYASSINGNPIPAGEYSFGDDVSRSGAVSAQYYRLNGDLGDRFDLHVELGVTGIAEPFVYDIPVEKAAASIVKLEPNQSIDNRGFAYTVHRLEMTPITSRLVLDSAGLAPAESEYAATKMYYELVSDSGQAVEPRKIDFFDGTPKAAYAEDQLYPPFDASPTSVTVRPYSYAIGPNGKLITDTDGRKVKTYYPDLEMTIPMP